MKGSNQCSHDPNHTHGQIIRIVLLNSCYAHCYTPGKSRGSDDPNVCKV